MTSLSSRSRWIAPALVGFLAAGALAISGCSLGLPASVPDAGAPDAGFDVIDAPGSDPPSCGGQGVTFTPRQWTPPAAVHANRCTVPQIQTLSRCLFDPGADKTSCDAFRAAPENLDCTACSVTSVLAPTHGPVLTDNEHYGPYTNVPGCMAVKLGDTSAAGCGAKYEQLTDCEQRACGGCPTKQDFDNCRPIADKGLCAPYAAVLACVKDVGRECTAFSAVDEGNTIIQLFCGPP